MKGKTEYMPAALSRYETARSAAMTGWMTVALIILKNKVVAYRAPSTLVRPACVVLHVQVAKFRVMLTGEKDTVPQSCTRKLLFCLIWLAMDHCVQSDKTSFSKPKPRPRT